MADLIKKIKIKKQDGSFTDYIPIGAEAQNVNMQNDYSVQENIGNIDIEEDGNIDEQLKNIHNKFNSNYYDEITYTKFRYGEADCYLTTIPKYASDGSLIKMYVADGVDKSPLKYAQDNYTTLTLNSSLVVKYNTGSSIPSVIGNGQILRSNDLVNKGVADNMLYVCINDDRSYREYKVGETTAQQMLDDGCKNVFNVYWKLVHNGQPVDLTDFYTNEGKQADEVRGPRQWIGIQADGTILLFTCDGRTNTSLGIYSHEQQELLIQYNCLNGWNLDGGGSTSTVIKGSKLNRNVDGNWTQDRFIRYTLNVKKETENEEIAKVYSKIGEEKQNTIQQIVPLIQNENKKLTVGIMPSQHTLTAEELENYPIGFGRILGDSYSTDFMTWISDEDERIVEFKIGKTGYFKITSTISLISRSVGRKILSCKRTNIDYTIPGSTISASGTLDSASRVELVSQAFIHNDSVNHTYSLLLSAQENDKIEEGIIMIEEL